MPVGSLQAAIIATITAIAGLFVAFAVISGEAAQNVVAAASVIVPSIFVIANAIIHHGETPGGTPPTKTVGRP